MNYLPRELSTATPAPAQWSTPEPPGIIQQYGGVLTRLGLLLDSTIILGVLISLAGMVGRWTQRDLTLGLIGVCSFAITSSSISLYRSWRMTRLRHELAGTAVAWTVAFGLTVALSNLFFEPGAQMRQLLLAWFAVALVGLTSYRVGMRLALRYYRAYGHDRRRVAFIGDTEVSRRLAEVFKKNVWMGIDVVAICDACDGSGLDKSRAPGGGAVPDVEALVERAHDHSLSAIYISLPMSAEARIKEIVDAFSDTTVAIYYCPPPFGFDPVNARWGDINGHMVMSMVESPFSSAGRRSLKRAEDLLVASAILVFIAPLLVITAIAVKLTSPGPVLFRQQRYGLDGREFSILKFRTMRHCPQDAAFVQATRNDARVTPLGAFLRKTSIDELPQFFNVLLGQMSVVGPRPHPVQLNEAHRKLIPRYMLRHIVKPGITGWAQVNGYRGETETTELMTKRVEFDLQYIKSWSVRLDLYILVRTVLVGFTGTRAY
jgi:putative colanic acid biosynthesis UDP-glucose lipid carrier transferase